VLKRLFDSPEILLLDGARHHLANESETVRRRYGPLLTAYLKAPSARC
jgi:hypothetical protein